MIFIEKLAEGMNVSGIYLVKTLNQATTKTGKTYYNLILQDKTGMVDAKIWDPNSPGIDDFEALDYIDITGQVISFNNALQVNIRRARRARDNEYEPSDYLPSTDKDANELFREVLAYVDSVKNPYLNRLLNRFFREDADFVRRFQNGSAAKTVHHGFIGGLMEHTVSVTRLCDYFAKYYPILKRDLLITSSLLHDAGKTRELAPFPKNDYTDEGQMLGHIMIGAEMIHDAAKEIEGFPEVLESELKHCILAHHGELEYGSPKKPALAEAMALNLADNADARLETLTELFHNNVTRKTPWLGYNKLMESNIRRTTEIDEEEA